MKITKVRIPLTDVYGRDVFTWHKVDIKMSERWEEHRKRTKKEFESKKKNSEWKIHVQWFWRVNP